MAELVLRDDHGGCAVLTLNRPDALNALSPRMFEALRAHIDAIAAAEDEIGVVILTGAGRSFSAGNDLKAIQAGEIAPTPHFQAETIEALEALPQPVIGAVKGHCYTGSLELALGCDLIIAGESAKFCDTHGKWGMSPTWGMGSRLPRRIVVQRAKEMMYSGRVVTGAEAATIGLALECVPDETLIERARTLAAAFLENSWFTLRADKMLVNGAAARPGADGPKWERANSPGRGPDMEARLAAFGKK